eukprot:9643534-Heterocapsa_arctica.AAC.1
MKHIIVGDFPWGLHTLKDARAEWCREKRFIIERIRGDGNCLYTCLGKSVDLDGDQIRQIIVDRADECCKDLMEYDIDGSALAHSIEHTKDRTERGRAEHIGVFPTFSISELKSSDMALTH